MPDNPTALITGAARGIGADVARQLAAGGYHVIITARDAAAAALMAEELRAAGPEATALGLDTSDPASITAVAEALGGRPLEVLVNNAAAFADWGETAATADLEAAATVVDTNLFGPWRVVQALLPSLRLADGARVVNVGSGSGSHGDPVFGLGGGPAAAAYAVSKAALHALTRKLAVELAAEGITVVAVDPGLTATAPGMEAMGARPVPEGAASVVWAATSADADAGSFTRDGAPMPW